MKKITFLAAAVAMLAFASCNKNEDQVALKFGAETYTSGEKQAYESNAVYFTAGDQVYINNELCTVNPIGNGRKGTIWCAFSESGYKANYGDVRYENGQWKTTFKSNVTLIPMNGNTVISSIHQPWPMSGKVATASETLVFKHNVALISPSIKYGMPFAESMFGADMPFAESTWDGQTLPTLTVTKVELISNTIKLTGDAHLININSSAPSMQMDDDPFDGTLNANDMITCTFANPAGFTVTPSTTDDEIGYRMGLVTVAPVDSRLYENRRMTIKYYITFNFGTTVRNFIYTGTINLNDNVEVKRASRFSIMANYYNTLHDEDYAKFTEVQ